MSQVLKIYAQYQKIISAGGLAAVPDDKLKADAKILWLDLHSQEPGHVPASQSSLAFAIENKLARELRVRATRKTIR